MNNQVSPVAAGVIIVILIAIAGFFLWRSTGASGKKELTPEARAHLMGGGGNSAQQSFAAHPLARRH